jgi:hypothetical protein
MEQRSRDVPSDKSSEETTEKPAAQYMAEYMDINAEDTVGDSNETIGAIRREKDKERGARHQKRVVTGSFGQDPVVDSDTMKLSNCIEPCVEDPTINEGDHMVGELEVTRQQADHVAGKETCTANVASVQYGPQKEVALTPPSITGIEVPPTASDPPFSTAEHIGAQRAPQLSNEEASKARGKTRTWKRKAKEHTVGSIQNVKRKRKIEDEEWVPDDAQEAQTKRSRVRGEAPNQLAMAVADPQPRPPQ